MPCVIKILAPEAVASAVIGKGGATIAAMRQSAQAKISLSDQSELYPGTNSRVLTAQANTEESLADVAAQVIAKIAECAQAATSEQPGQPDDPLQLQALSPRFAVSGLIGKGGAAIARLRESTGAKISVSESTGGGPCGEQVVSATGSQQALEQVMAEVNHQIQAVNKESWFVDWASSTVPAVTAARHPGHGYNPAPPPVARTAGHGAPAPRAPDLGVGAGAAGMDMMFRIAQGLPGYVVEDARGFAMSCVVPNRLVGGLIGRGGSGTKEVQQLTGTKIGIREIPGDAENRSMNIAGPLAGTCAAYMLMMRRYLDAEAQVPGTAPAPEQRAGRR